MPFILYNLSIKYKWVNKMIRQQQSLPLSAYSGIYDLGRLF